jgi:hypothetical protein
LELPKLESQIGFAFTFFGKEICMVDPTLIEENRPGFGQRLKDAGQLAARHAQRAKLVTMTLPATYKALGRHLYGSKAFQDEFPETYQEFDRLAAEMKAIKTQAGSRPTADGITAKAKAVTAAAKDIAQTKALEMKVAQAFGRFGEAVFDKHGEQSGPVEMVKPIADARAQVAVLDGEITNLGRTRSGQFLTTKRIMVAGIIALPLIALGIGKMFSEKRKLMEGEAWFANQDADIKQQEIEAQATKAKADDLWRSGKQEDAVEAYKGLVMVGKFHRSAGQYHIGESERSRAFSRIIDYYANNNGIESAKDFAERAIEDDLMLSVTTTKGNAVYENEKGNEKGTASANSVNDTNTLYPTPDEPSNSGSSPAVDNSRTAPPGGQPSSSAALESVASQTFSVSKGILSGSLTVSVAADISDEISVSDFDLDDGRLYFKLHLNRATGVSSDQSPWHYSVFDSDDTKTDGGAVVFNGSISPGLTVKADCYIEDVKPAVKLEIER